MAKIIVERPRWGSGMGVSNNIECCHRHADAGDCEIPRKGKWLHGKVGISRAILGGTKSLSENLAPLKRYFESNVGRPWDKVFSDMSRHISFDNVVQRHIWQHVQDYVCIHAWKRGDGRIVVRNSWGRLDFLEQSICLFYVDPVTKLLCKNKNRNGGWWRKWEIAAENRRKSIHERRREIHGRNMHQYHKIKGIWYEVELAYMRDFEERIMRDAVLLKIIGETIYRELMECYGCANVFGREKRQLSNKELTRLGLRNDVPHLPNLVIR